MADIKLACDLIKEQLGELSAVVAKSLARSSGRTLHELVRDTSQTPQVTKETLLVLLQHSCVVAWSDEDANESQNQSAQDFTQREKIVYEIQVDRILNRMRFPRFLVHILEELGPDAEAMVETFLVHGRLSFAMIVEKGVAAAASGESSLEPAQIEAAALQLFCDLVKERYLERVPLGFAARPKPLATKATGGRGRGAAKAGSHAAAQQEAANVAAMGERAREQAERFTIPPEFSRRLAAVSTMLRQGHSEAEAAAAGCAASSAAGGGNKRKRGAGEMMGGEMASSDGPDDVLWRVNFDEFNRRFRHKSCVALVRQKMGGAAAAVLAAMLRLSRPHEADVREERSPPLSESKIHAEVLDVFAPGDPSSPTKADISSTLDLLSLDGNDLVTLTGEGPGGKAYCVNMKRIIDVIRIKEVEAVVRERFGAPTCRIFRLLALKGLLEMRQIADMAMVPQHATREYLYRLLKAGYVRLQEVAKSADHAPSRTFYLWRVELLGAVEQLGVDLYRAASNIRGRLAYQMEKEAELLKLLEQVEAARRAEREGRPALAAPVVTPAQQQQLKHLQSVVQALETSLMRLDELILIFRVL
eukprot:CAMPEP_0170134692 /NCGR_PEP_ID=MMETSP0033_2-20121228/2052_1 /TAXON_ID=195969 /ORGANISM="Dolichomastix tenuilepis, Strain CCMP3274" /LENGTH=587 /DNA_ID=CAMNT_0010370261 /DNA_START=23 /DNA_END=1786 /DNA_ORIENTATION=-